MLTPCHPFDSQDHIRPHHSKFAPQQLLIYCCHRFVTQRRRRPPAPHLVRVCPPSPPLWLRACCLPGWSQAPRQRRRLQLSSHTLCLNRCAAGCHLPWRCCAAATAASGQLHGCLVHAILEPQDSHVVCKLGSLTVCAVVCCAGVQAGSGVQWAMSELPVDYTFWLEQGMDPTHANFLHHTCE